MTDPDQLLKEHFKGKIVRKDLTKSVKEGANVPVFVLEYLLGDKCTSDDEELIQDGIKDVKRILTDNFVRPDEAEKIKSLVREKGRHKVIDKVGVQLNTTKDIYEAEFSALGIRGVEIPTLLVKQYEKLLVGGMWAVVTMEYFFEEGQKGSPFSINKLIPIQMPNMDMDELFEGRKEFNVDQWLDVLIRSTGMEPTVLEERVKWHLLARLIPFVENNYNACELGPKGTGKSHVYKEVSPNSILISGGQTTVANLFYNMARRQIGLVGTWDLIAFDEVAGINFKDRDGIQIMKDYMASGSFSRGKEAISASASMMFIGNIDNVSSLLRTSHLLAPFPEVMIDSAFFDRFHSYIPGWEIPKMRPEFFTDRYGFIVDYLAEMFREMRKHNFSDAIGKYFQLGRDLNQRDTIAVKRTVSGLLKLLYPHGEYEKEDVRKCLEYALESRRRVKEQLKRIGGMEFYDVNFSYIDLEENEEKHVGVHEERTGSLIQDGALQAGSLYTVARGASGHLGLYRIETQITAGTGQLKMSGIGSNAPAKEALKVGHEHFRANAKQLQASLKPMEFNYHLHLVELHNTGPASSMTLSSYIALCSAIMDRPIVPRMVVLGSMSLGGNIDTVENLAEYLQAAADAGAKRILLPMSSGANIATVPIEIMTRFQLNFYADSRDAVFKALGVQE